MKPAEKRRLNDEYETAKKVYSFRKQAYESIKDNPTISPIMISIRLERYEAAKEKFFKLERLLRK